MLARESRGRLRGVEGREKDDIVKFPWQHGRNQYGFKRDPVVQQHNQVFGAGQHESAALAHKLLEEIGQAIEEAKDAGHAFEILHIVLATPHEIRLDETESVVLTKTISNISKDQVLGILRYTIDNLELQPPDPGGFGNA